MKTTRILMSFTMLMLSVFLSIISVSAWAVDITFLNDKTILADDMSFEGMNITVSGCTLSIEGKHTFRNLILTNKAKVTSLSRASTLELFVTNIVINAGCSIDVLLRDEFGTVHDNSSYEDIKSKPIGTVNGVVISLTEWAKQMEVLMLTRVDQSTGEATQLPVGMVAIESIIDRMLLMQFSTEQKCLPTNKEVNDELNKRMTENVELLQQLGKVGRTLEDLRADIMVELAQEKLLARGLTVTEDEIQDVYDQTKNIPSYQGGLRIPASARILMIMTSKDEDKINAEDDLKNGVDFQVIAKKYNEDPNLKKNYGAPTQPFIYEQLETNPIAKILVDAVKPLKPGDTTAWLELTFPGGQDAQDIKQWVIVKVISQEQEKIAPLDDSLKAKIKRVILYREGSENLQKELLEFRKKAKVTIIREPWKTQFSEIEKKLKEAPQLFFEENQ